MKRVRVLLGFGLGIGLCITGTSYGGSIGDPGATLRKGQFAAGPEVSGVYREIRDGDGIRYDTESWRLLLKGSYGITNRLEGSVRAGGATMKIRGTPFDGNLGWAGGAGLKATFLDPPGHALRYGLGGQFLYFQSEDRDSTGKWLEYDLWIGAAYKESTRLTPYGGIAYSRVDGKMGNFPPRPALDSYKSPTALGGFFRSRVEGGARFPPGD